MPLSATKLASDINYAIIWEELHSCQEAAFSDCPHEDILASIFSKRALGNSIEDQELGKTASLIHEAACKLKDSSGDEEWFAQCYQSMMVQIAHAHILSSSESWLLPNVRMELSEADIAYYRTRDVLRVTEVQPTASIQMPLTCKSALALFTTLNDPSAYASTAIATRTIPFVHASQSPYADSPTAQFFSTAFSTAAQLPFERMSQESHFYALRRYNRLATTTLVRQLSAFGIDTPVFGVLLSKSLVAIHVDWVVEVDGQQEVDSAFFPSDDDETDIKQWDLRDAADVCEVASILDGLAKYTSTLFASRVTSGIIAAQMQVLHGQFKPWKLDANILPFDDDDDSGVDSSSLDSSIVGNWNDEQHDVVKLDEIVRVAGAIVGQQRIVTGPAASAAGLITPASD